MRLICLQSLIVRNLFTFLLPSFLSVLHSFKHSGEYLALPYRKQTTFRAVKEVLQELKIGKLPNTGLRQKSMSQFLI